MIQVSIKLSNNVMITAGTNFTLSRRSNETQLVKMRPIVPRTSTSSIEHTSPLIASAK